MKHNQLRHTSIWPIAGGRAALGWLAVSVQQAGWSGASLAAAVIVALLSDIFDGVLATRWACDVAPVRLFDTLADTIFRVGAGRALWRRRRAPLSELAPRSMRRLGGIRACLIGAALITAGSAAAEPIRPVTWLGGTASGLVSGVTGRVEIDSPERLTFRGDTGVEVAIPYDAVQSFSYRCKVKHHLGVLPAIAVGLVAARQHRHIIAIGYTDPVTQARQAVMLDVPRDGAALLLSLLRERTSVCPPTARQACGGTVQ